MIKIFRLEDATKLGRRWERAVLALWMANTVPRSTKARGAARRMLAEFDRAVDGVLPRCAGGEQWDNRRKR